MNWDIVQGKWKQVSGAVKAKWGKLTDDDLQTIGGHRDQLLGKLQEKYGIAKDQAEQQLSEFENNYSESEARQERKPARASR